MENDQTAHPIIISRDNQTFKHLLSLKQKKFRKEFCQCIVEGEKQIRDLITMGQTEIIQIHFRKSSFIKYENRFTETNIPLHILSDQLFSAVTDLETDPGILAVVSIPPPRPLTYPYLLLDRIADSGNMGTLLRTAAAFGFETILCLDCADPFSPKVLRASMGTQFALNIRNENLNTLKNQNLAALFAADLNGAAISSAQTAAQKANKKYGIALGSEGSGLAPEIKALCTQSVTIPMTPNAESLNVAVAGGILMHALNTPAE